MAINSRYRAAHYVFEKKTQDIIFEYRVFEETQERLRTVVVGA